ncbi:ABC transporter, ATPase subunit [Candidatus Koribacter versatilis Ellin345]|uniref:ABC transporter, ATPase subunit n=1 Tax=Koribacter versatilis (strain Ellin345) TaxID=204669 RepID=Q1IRR0_KORVE|nr:ABC transporter ATP-binding protein [Candidatus Koribacter versatilis]ABF40440.1 ABC transporter, ATPase subunit [Candidatus Koribacter versatilis Ellin345]
MPADVTPTLCLSTQDLTHRYAGHEAPVLTDVNLKVAEGSIYGFLGPNGAGKTTTLRLVLGLLQKQQGTISILQRDLDSHRIEVLKHVGSLIETPSLYEHLTAVENLQIMQRIHRAPATRIDEVLSPLGLFSARHKKAGQYSLGMKQRLSIAIALLHRPSLLILDEPTNGLDPSGIIEIRELLKKLNREDGVTILISSHLLGEIEKIATHVGVIHRGRLMFQGTLAELRETALATGTATVCTSDNLQALKVIHPHHPDAHFADGRICVPSVSPENLARINRLLVQQGIDVYGLTPSGDDLENIFMEMVSHS